MESAFCTFSKSCEGDWTLKFIKKSHVKSEQQRSLVTPHHYVCCLNYDSSVVEFYVYLATGSEFGLCRGEINNLLTTEGKPKPKGKYIRISTRLVKNGEMFFLYDQNKKMDSMVIFPSRKGGAEWILIDEKIMAVSVGVIGTKAFFNGDDGNLYSSPLYDNLKEKPEAYYEGPLVTPEFKKKRRQYKKRLLEEASTFAVILKTKGKCEKLVGLFSSLDKANEWIDHGRGTITNYATQKYVVRPMEGDMK
jgi:hypothetical protein